MDYYSNRHLDNGFNISSNYPFIAINIVVFAGQVTIIFLGGRVFDTVRITGVQWATCIGLASVSYPWAMLIRATPDGWVAGFWRMCGRPVVGVLKAAWDAVAAGFMRVFRRRGEENGGSEES